MGVKIMKIKERELDSSIDESKVSVIEYMETKYPKMTSEFQKIQRISIHFSS